jgi:hypothetical protein
MTTEPMAWDIAARLLVDDEGIPVPAARDTVILEWLREGDTRPFYDWVLCGHVPSQAVLTALAYMMFRADSDRFDPALMPHQDFAASLRYGLEVRRPGSGRPRDMERELLGRLAGRQASKLMDEGAKGRDDADPSVRDFLAECGANVSLGTVEAARKEYRRRRRAHP